MMLKLTFTWIFIAAMFHGAAQELPENKIVRLKSQLHFSLPDSSRQRIYYELAKAFLQQNISVAGKRDSAIRYLQDAIAIPGASQETNMLYTNQALCQLGEIYFYQNNFKAGKLHFSQALANARTIKDKEQEAEIWHRQGAGLLILDIEPGSTELSYTNAINIYSELKNHRKKIALELELAYLHFRQGYMATAQKELFALLVESKQNGYYKTSSVYHYLALLMRYRGILNEGLNYALSAVQTMQISGDYAEAHDFYGELALTYAELNKPKEAVFWFRKCIEERKQKHFSIYNIYRTTSLMVAEMIKTGEERAALNTLQELEKWKAPQRPLDEAILQQSLAYCYQKLGQAGEAERNFVAMVGNYEKEERNAEVLSIANLDVAQFYVSCHKYEQATPYLKRVISLNATTPLKRKADLQFCLFKIDSANNNYLSALLHYQKYRTLNDSIFNLDKTKQIEELSIKYQSANKDKNIKVLEQDRALQQGKLQQANATRNWITGVAILFFIIIGLLIHNSRMRHKANKKLELQQIEIQQTNVSLQRLVEEKEWLVKEIHHRVKNNLHTISGLLDAQSGYLTSAEALQAIKDSQHRVQSMSLIHQKLYQSQDMSVINMPGYINELVSYLKHSFIVKPSIRFDIQVEQVNLDVSFAIPIGLILNEAITNAIKYAFPAQQEGLVRVSLKHTGENSLLLSIADDGVGIPDDFDFKTHQSMGVNLMRGLSQEIDGIFLIKRSNGTLININFEYDPDTLINAFSKDHA